MKITRKTLKHKNINIYTLHRVTIFAQMKEGCQNEKSVTFLMQYPVPGVHKS